MSEPSNHHPPLEPPMEWSEENTHGYTRAQYIRATRAWGTFQSRHAHPFERCTQCPGCGLCRHCAYLADHPVHQGQTRCPGC